MVGLLVAVGTAASLIISAVHGFWIVVAVICAALAAGLVAYANSLKKMSAASRKLSSSLLCVSFLWPSATNTGISR